ncbi:MAG: GGDEF domain-containing protein [Burkholderiaceae bacterium]
MDSKRIYSAPKWRFVRWLLDSGKNVPADIRHALVASLFGTLPIFVGGVVNTIGIAAVAAVRNPTPWFIAWLVMELVLGLTRVLVLKHALHAAAHGKNTYTDLYILLAMLWAASVGYGAGISLVSGDWTIAALSCLSTAAMAGGICFRNFGAPRLAATMMFLSMSPIAFASLFAKEPIFLVALIQVPFYLYSMSVAATKLNSMLVTTMRAERDNERRAQHDVLTGLLNRAGLSAAIDRYCGVHASTPCALLYLDLVGFKRINDTFGHPTGDMLLKTLAARLSTLVVDQGVAARVGGDEFVLLMLDMSPAGAQALANRVIDAVAQPFEHTHTLPSLGVTVGIAMAPEHGTDFDTLIARADEALYRAKVGGRSATCFAAT